MTDPRVEAVLESAHWRFLHWRAQASHALDAPRLVALCGVQPGWWRVRSRVWLGVRSVRERERLAVLPRCCRCVRALVAQAGLRQPERDGLGSVPGQGVVL